MKWGIIKLYCQMCGTEIEYNGNKPTLTMHHKEFGILCSRACYDKAEMKYARMILGKNDLAP
jgi:L-serine deaminase